jgi:hypothetical protein
MRKQTGFPCHQCAPKEWRHTQNLTGSYELDAVICGCSNKDMVDRIKDHLTCAGNSGYGPRTSYSGYNGYSGDD